MNYQEKLALTDKIALDIESSRSINDIKTELSSQGLYEQEISNIIIGAQNAIGDKHLESIKSLLKQDGDVFGMDQLKHLDKELIQSFVVKAKNRLRTEEKKKVSKSMRDGMDPMEVLNNVDFRFYSAEDASAQLAKLKEVRHNNSGSGRMIRILGGVGLIALTAILLFTTGRLFYFLPIIGIIMIVKGFLTESME